MSVDSSCIWGSAVGSIVPPPTQNSCLPRTRDRHRGEDDVKAKAEIVVMWLQTKDHQGPPEARKRQGVSDPWNHCREPGPADTLISNLWSLET